MRCILLFLFMTLTNSLFSQVTDIDGHTYNTKKIGNKLWMTENLRVTRFNNGDSIPLVIENEKWENLSYPGYCFYDNKPENIKLYGLLYNGYVISKENVCPIDWHIPNAKEWKLLSRKFKQKRPKNKIDTLSVKKISGHRRGMHGQYYIFETNTLFDGNGPWWCSSNSKATGWNRFLDYVYLTYKGGGYREDGISIRCVKD